MEFDKSKVLTCVTADQAKAGDVGWLSDTLSGIRAKVERGDAPEEIVRVLPDDYIHRFKPEANAHMLFYPAPYEYLQAKWVEENELKVGDSIRITKTWEVGENGFTNSGGRTLVGRVYTVNEIKKQYISVEDPGAFIPYFAIEKVKEPEYLPFANAEEFAPYRDMWFKTKEGGDSFTRKVEEYCYDGVKIRGQHLKYICFLDEYVFADDNTPAGVKNEN